MLKHLKSGARPIGAAAVVMQSVKRIKKINKKIPTCREFQEYPFFHHSVKTAFQSNLTANAILPHDGPGNACREQPELVLPACLTLGSPLLLIIKNHYFWSSLWCFFNSRPGMVLGALLGAATQGASSPNHPGFRAWHYAT